LDFFGFFAILFSRPDQIRTVWKKAR